MTIGRQAEESGVLMRPLPTLLAELRLVLEDLRQKCAQDDSMRQEETSSGRQAMTSSAGNPTDQLPSPGIGPQSERNGDPKEDLIAALLDLQGVLGCAIANTQSVAFDDKKSTG